MLKSKTFKSTQDQLVAKVVKELKQATFAEQRHTRKEVSELLKTSLSSIHNGIPYPYQNGGRIYFKASDIESSIIKLEK